MRLTSRSTGIKEEMVLASPAAPDRFVFPLELRGLTASMDAGGEVVYRDTAGKEWARTPRGYMFDSAVDPASGEPATSQGVTYALIPKGRGVALEVRLDRAWLADPARKWPITVDPELHAATWGDDTYVMSGFNRDNSYDAELKVGTYDGGAHIGRSYMRFDTAALGGATVARAELHLAERHSWNCGAWPEAAYRVTGGWERATQWPGAPVDPNWAGGVWAGGSCPNRLATWNVTGMAAYWAAAREPKGSISLRATNEGENNLYKKYSSTEGGNPPALHVWYSFQPVVPYAVTPAHGARVFTPSNPASAYYADGDGTPGKILFAVYNYATQLVTAGWSPTVCSGCQGTWTIPALPDGWYQLYAIGHDGANYSPAWAGPEWFFIDTLPPAVPTNIAPGPGAYVSSGVPITASARYSEPYGWSGQVLFHVLNSSGGIAVSKWSSTVASGATAQVSLGTLPIGTYTMWTYAYDGQLAWTSHSFNVAAMPGAPSGLSARAGAESAQVSWSGVSTGDAPISKVSVTAADLAGGTTQVACTGSCLSDKTVFVPGLVAGHSYRFIASATNPIGTGPSGSASSDPNPLVILTRSLLTPSSVRADEGDMTATVSWTPGLLDLPAITSYTVNVYQDGVQSPVMTRDAGIGTALVVDGLRNGSGYSFSVIANTIFGPAPESDRSSPSVVPAGRPFPATIASVQAANSRASVTWSEPAPRDGVPGNNGAPITGWNVTVLNVDAARSVVRSVDALAPDQRSLEVDGLDNGTTYLFTVRSTNAKGNSDPVESGAVVPFAAPFAPENVFATGGRRAATITWQEPSPRGPVPGNNGRSITEYRVLVDPGCGGWLHGNIGEWRLQFDDGGRPGPRHGVSLPGRGRQRSRSGRRLGHRIRHDPCRTSRRAWWRHRHRWSAQRDRELGGSRS